MSNKIDDETLEYVGILAKLNIEGEEKEKARADMEKMLDYVDKLAELDTSEAEPLVQAIDLQMHLRKKTVSMLFQEHSKNLQIFKI